MHNFRVNPSFKAMVKLWIIGIQELSTELKRLPWRRVINRRSRDVFREISPEINCLELRKERIHSGKQIKPRKSKIVTCSSHCTEHPEFYVIPITFGFPFDKLERK